LNFKLQTEQPQVSTMKFMGKKYNFFMGSTAEEINICCCLYLINLLFILLFIINRRTYFAGKVSRNTIL